jgi:DNA repair protein RadC
LEFLLNFAIPYTDNSELSRELIDRFGSFIKTVDAEQEALLNVGGVNKHIVYLFETFQQLSQVYFEKKARAGLLELFTVERLKNYCSSLFINAANKEIHCLYLTDDLKLISSERVCSDFDMPVRRIVRSAFANNCNRLAITHNHPSGNCVPSMSDISATKEIYLLLKKMEIDLIDHIVVGRNGVTSMKEGKFFCDY